MQTAVRIVFLSHAQELEAKDEQFVRCRGSQWSLSGVDGGIWRKD